MTEGALQRIGRYEILADLGQGAMGVVYEARDPQLERVVAIKTLRRDLGLPPEEYADLKKRFYQEAKAAGRLNHPNIVIIHDVVEIDEIPYIVMEYLKGRTLAELIRTSGPLSTERVVDLVAQVCGALDYAHANAVVHRDIKPANVIVTANGVAKVSDFGIARIAGSSVTRTGVVVGTPAYMSPEQLRGRVPDGRSDLFSLGVVLYEALTGVNPFQSDDLTATLYQVVQVDPPPLRQRNPSVPVWLERVTARVMAKEPDQRYATARELAQALREAWEAADAAETVRLVPAGPGPKRVRRLPRAALLAAGLLVVVGIGAWAFWGRQSPDETAPTAGAGAAAGPIARGQAGTRAGVVAGAIVVTTDPSVEVFLDGVPKGRTGDLPLVLTGVPAGERLITLQRGARKKELSETVREGQTLQVTYHFGDDGGDAPLGQLFEKTRDRLLDTAREKLREVAPERLRDLVPEKPRETTPRKGKKGGPDD